jgi:transcriptional regulator with XRE-family HTH domain
MEGDVVNEFAKALLAWRKLEGFTQKQAAACIGIPPATYIHWEHGERMPSDFVVKKIMEQINEPSISIPVGGLKLAVDNAKQVGTVAVSVAVAAE